MYKNIKTFIICPCMLAMITFFIGMPYAYPQVENTKEAALEQNISASPVDDEQGSKNPFQPYTPLDEEPAVQEIYGAGGSLDASSGASEDKFDYSSLRVTGSVWGNNMPKAIINDQVMGIGDVVNEAKILNITKDGILFEFKDKQYLMKREGVAGK
ncbi:MAG: hypothetical protein V1840_02215 [Candidatus Omnitrophota bacterium]